MALDASIMDAVQQALRSPPPAIVQEIESPIPAEAEAFFELQNRLITNFEARRKTYIERITLSVSALIARAQGGEGAISVDQMTEIVGESEAALGLSRATVELHESMSGALMKTFHDTDFRPRVRRAAERIVRATALQHNALVKEHLRLVAALADIDPEASEIVGSASTGAQARSMLAELRAS